MVKNVNFSTCLIWSNHLLPLFKVFFSWSNCTFPAFISEVDNVHICRELSIPSDPFQELPTYFITEKVMDLVNINLLVYGPLPG